jgi:hypothetical protein
MINSGRAIEKGSSTPTGAPDHILEPLAVARTYPDRLAIPKHQQLLSVATKEIDRIQAEGKYPWLLLGNPEHEFGETLADPKESGYRNYLEAMVDPNHKSIRT